MISKLCQSFNCSSLANLCFKETIDLRTGLAESDIEWGQISMDRNSVTLPLFSNRQLDSKKYFILLDGPKLGTRIPKNLNELCSKKHIENVQ